jgi:maltose O-acetyltransferase
VFDGVGRTLLRVKAWWLFGQWRVHVFGDFTAINPSNIQVGTNVAFNHEVFLLARSGITIGNDVVLSARCMLIDTGLDGDGFMPAIRRRHFSAPIILEDGVWIGAGAIILAGVTIGRNSIVGAGSVVVSDVPANSVVAGNPARVLRQGTS